MPTPATTRPYAEPAFELTTAALAYLARAATAAKRPAARVR